MSRDEYKGGRICQDSPAERGQHEDCAAGHRTPPVHGAGRGDLSAAGVLCRAEPRQTVPRGIPAVLSSHGERYCR